MPRCFLGPIGRDVVVGAKSGLPFESGLVETGPGLLFAEDGELAVGHEVAGAVLLIGEVIERASGVAEEREEDSL